MGTLELVVSAAVWAIVVVSVGRIVSKAGYSWAWGLVPLALAAVTYATVAAVHAHTKFGAITLHTLIHQQRALLIADAACAGAMVLLLAVFAFADWPALTPALVPAPSMRRNGLANGNGHGNGNGNGHGNGKQRGGVRVAATAVPARMQIRALPDVSGKPAGWFATGALGSGEQSYWDGSAWTARRCWRNEMWVDLPADDLQSTGIA